MGSTTSTVTIEKEHEMPPPSVPEPALAPSDDPPLDPPRPVNTVGRCLWEHVLIRDRILDHLCRVDDDMERGKTREVDRGALFKLLTVNQATFRSAVLLLYRSVGTFPAAERLFLSDKEPDPDFASYMYGVGANIDRARLYANSVRSVTLPHAIMELEDVELARYFAYFPHATKIKFPVEAYQNLPLGRGALYDLTLHTDPRAGKIENVSIEILRHLEDPSAGKFIWNLFLHQGAQQLYSVTALSVSHRLDGQMDCASLRSHLLEACPPESPTLHFGCLKTLDLDSVIITESEIKLMADSYPDLFTLTFTAERDIPRDAIRRLFDAVVAGWPRMKKLHIRYYSHYSHRPWDLSLSESVDTLAGRLPNLTELGVVLGPSSQSDAVMSEDKIFGPPVEPRYPKLQELSILTCAARENTTSVLDANGQVLQLVGRSCKVQAIPGIGSPNRSEYHKQFNACRAAVLRHFSRADPNRGWRVFVENLDDSVAETDTLCGF